MTEQAPVPGWLRGPARRAPRTCGQACRPRGRGAATPWSGTQRLTALWGQRASAAEARAGVSSILRGAHVHKLFKYTNEGGIKDHFPDLRFHPGPGICPLPGRTLPPHLWPPGRERENCSGVVATAQTPCLSRCLGPGHCQKPSWALQEGGQEQMDRHRGPEHNRVGSPRPGRGGSPRWGQHHLPGKVLLQTAWESKVRELRGPLGGTPGARPQPHTDSDVHSLESKPGTP